ncbi:hypothetical protein B0J14DRAFT_232591 [Halenospora varia]|nr:hypothetical protein B0J14DRAFT_232591 [Halenospora varia]
MDIQSLPLEIVRRIASFVPCDSIFNLLKASRRLHDACNDHLVFKQIIDFSNSRNGTRWNTGILPHNTSASHCSRFAVADMMAWSWVSDQRTFVENAAIRDRSDSDIWSFDDAVLDLALPFRDDSKYCPSGEVPCGRGHALNSVSQLCKWAPYLSVLQHPFLDHTNLAGLVCQVSESRIRSPDEVWSIGHILTCAFLAQTHHYLSDNLVEIHLNLLHGTEVLHSALETHNIRKSCEYNWPPLFVCAILQYSHHCATTGVKGAILPPLPSAMFNAANLYEKFPLRLGAAPSKESISHSQGPGLHISTMLTQEFLEDGEWVGYYSNSMLPESFDLELPMTGVYFQVCDEIRPHLMPSFSAHPFQSLTSEGSDSVGTFNLEGHISSLDGAFGMEKSYHSGPTWEWKGRMTPFGIVGTWGSFGDTYGYVWLWKRAWSPEIPEWLKASYPGP